MAQTQSDRALAAIGLGGNEGPVAETLRHALKRMAALPETDLVATSPTYWTPAWGVSVPQADHLNAVVLINTGLSPHALLMALQVIETDLGRTRNGERYGPRSIDLDLLVHGQHLIDDEVLCLPHPRLHQRGFVLVPLNDVAPELEIPGLDSVRYLLESLDEDELEGIRPAHIELSA